MKKQIMTAFAVSTMMTLAMPFASFAAARSCQTGFLYGNSESPIYRTHRRFCYLRVSYPAIFRTCERFSRQF